LRLSKISQDKAINVKIVRSYAKFELYANICKYFECIETQWIWLLRDDGLIEANSIRSILDSIQRASQQTAIIKFGEDTVMPPVNNPIQFEGLQKIAEFMNMSWRYSSILSISNSVFKVSNIRKHLNIAYNWSYSCAPYLAILLPAMRDGCITLIEPNSILENALGSRDLVPDFAKVLI
jgi:hypothetical protein